MSMARNLRTDTNRGMRDFTMQGSFKGLELRGVTENVFGSYMECLISS